MSVWLTIPSARPPAEANPVMEKWREMGYKIALMRDYADEAMCDHMQSLVPYPGYANAVNILVSDVMRLDPQAEWFVAAGDDTLPDPHHTADEIADQCRSHFYEARLAKSEIGTIEVCGEAWELSTFGVMQPTGDRFGQSPHFHPAKDRGDGIACGCGYMLTHPVHTGGAYIDRVAGSAWYGRSYCERMYGGKGPLWHEYKHMFVDTEARDVAVKMGVYWERRDLIQVHNHWSRELGAKVPAFLEEVSGQAHWDKYKAIYEARKAAGFPGSEPWRQGACRAGQGVSGSRYDIVSQHREKGGLEIVFSPGNIELRVAGRVLESERFADSHEAEDIAKRFRDQSPDGMIMVIYDGAVPQIWEDFI